MAQFAVAHTLPTISALMPRKSCAREQNCENEGCLKTSSV